MTASLTEAPAVETMPFGWHSYGPQYPPECMPEIVGIFVGGCVYRGVGSRFRSMAHAHNHPGHEFTGWVCILSPRRLLNTRGDAPSRLMWHEYAHILTPGHGHDDKWRAVMRSLGQPIPTRYKTRVR